MGRVLTVYLVFFLKIGISVLAPSLVQLFNLSLSLGRFPDSWKMARVAPILKDGATDDKSNYRPISVLPVISRLFEKLIFDQLYDYLNRNQLIFLLQSAFRKLHSVLTCLLKSTNDWYLNTDKGGILQQSLSISKKLSILWIMISF